MEAIILFVVCIFLFLLYGGLGIYFMFSKKIANFWSGEKIPPKSVKDIKGFNRANGIMWLVYGILYLIPAFVSFINVLITGILLFVITFIGVLALIFISAKIIRPKYVYKE